MNEVPSTIELARLLREHGPIEIETVIAMLDLPRHASGRWPLLADLFDRLVRLAQAGLVQATLNGQPLAPEALRGLLSPRSVPPVALSTTPLLVEVQTALGLSLSQLATEARKGASPVSTAFGTLVARAEEAPLNTQYREDLLATLREVGTCFDAGCYVATLALAGKVLEIALRQLLMNAHITPNEPAMIG